MTNQTHIKNALQRPYNLQLFAKEVLNPVFGANFQMQQLTPATIEPTQTESKSIAKVYTYGTINLDDDTDIICYEINLQPKVKIEQSKIAIQHYARRLLTTGQAALINFVNPDNKNLWRFTFIAKDSIITEKGSLEKATNAKRYTYLLGTSESCKTAAQRFEILANETSLTIENLTNAFSVEKLSKDFFDEYLQHYNNFVEYLTQSNFRQSVFNANDKAVRDFTKKMLGRIVFLYFVQKKGWLGASDLDYTDGLQNFMMQYYFFAGANETFYENYLKKLFFDTLNKERENDNFEMPNGKTVKVPFLNGGLFDKTKYDNHILTFKSDLFHNNLNEDDPKHRGFLDFLNAYNFTIYEDSPDEQTVAVDPEMLGHIFENLLEDNKDKGAYYTPKEIVHYMCQESLTEYLKTNTENNENLEQLVKHKEINNIPENELQQIDNLLDNVKICDPAIGSGAFPMGLLQEIYNIKEVITYHTNNDWKPAQVKENIIQNSIYGVDIEKGAVDIARLRFWLSLVVDEEKPKPLPNLDYKIVVGNSLISKFEDEIIEIDWKLANNTALKQSRPDLFDKINININDIFNAQHDYFHSVSNKNKLKLKIRNLKIELLETLIKIEKQKLLESGIDINLATKKKERIETTERKIKYEGFNKMLSKLNILKTKPEKPLDYFNWELNFPEVLNKIIVKENAGFDIVIGNPPYFNIQTLGAGSLIAKAIQKKYSEIWQDKSDILFYFIAKAIDLSKSNISYIISNAFLFSNKAQKLRNFLLENTNISKIINFEKYMVFNDASITTAIIELNNNYKNKQTLAYSFKESKYSNLEMFNIINNPNSYFEVSLRKNHVFALVDNKIDLINERIDNSHPKLNTIIKCGKGMETAANKVFVFKNYPNKFPSEFIKQRMTGKAIKKYLIDNSKEYILYFEDTEKFDELPSSIQNHLLENKELLKKRATVKNEGRIWWRYSRPMHRELYHLNKIWCSYRAKNNIFCFDDTQDYIGFTNTTVIFDTNKKINLKYVLALLNSKILEFRHKNQAKQTGGGVFEYVPNVVDKLPIPEIPIEAQQPFIDKVDKILSLKKAGKGTSNLEQEIDEMVYKLYGLTEAEIQTVEESIKI